LVCLVEIELKKEVKYLGVILDSKLNWNSHIETRLEKATIARMKITGPENKSCVLESYGDCQTHLSYAWVIGWSGQISEFKIEIHFF
jgi:hypothetical protein